MPQVWALLCMTKLEMGPVLFYTEPDLGFTLELLHLTHLTHDSITCRAKSNGMEEALDDSDPKSTQNAAAAQHWSIQRPLCHCWEKPEGAKSAFNRGLAWCEAWPRPSGTIKEGVMAEMGSPLLGEPNHFILMITRVLCSVQTCLELQKQLQGVARCTKKLH